MAEGPNPKKKHLLHQLVKKVLIHSRQTIEIWHMLPNTQRFADCNIWLPMLDTDCTGPEVPWWQTFPVHKALQGRRVVFHWERSPTEVEPVYTSPLLEAKTYAGILKNDPFVKTQAELAREMGVSRVRITQVMNLLRLVPEVQEQLLQIEDQKAIRFFSEHRLRPLVQIEDTDLQVREFQKMLGQVQR